MRGPNQSAQPVCEKFQNSGCSVAVSLGSTRWGTTELQVQMLNNLWHGGPRRETLSLSPKPTCRSSRLYALLGGGVVSVTVEPPPTPKRLITFRKKP
jgi:hypothetical protein